MRHPDHAELVAYVEHVLPARARGAVNDHLRWCASCRQTMHDIQAVLSAPPFEEVHRFPLDLVLVDRAGEPIALETPHLRITVSRAFRHTLVFSVQWRGRLAAGVQVALELLHADGHRTDWAWTDTDKNGEAVLVRPSERDVESGTRIELCVAVPAQSQWNSCGVH